MKKLPGLLICVLFIFTAISYSCKKEDPEPPSVTSTSVTHINATSALSGGDISTGGDSPVTARGVCWSSSPNPTLADAHTTDGSGTGSYESMITGLQTEASYYVRAYATNNSGTAYGQEIFFDNSWEQSGTFIDMRDKKEYEWVKIGDQLWMAENLAYLPSVSPSSEGSETEPYYYVYAYEGSIVSEAKVTDNYNAYGVLFNWPAAMDACPDGWHLPSNEEWTELSDYLGGTSVAGGKLKETGTNYWGSPNTGATNESGFTALPGGERDINGTFGNIGIHGFWWSATERELSNVWGRSMFYNTSFVYSYYYYYKQGGLSVRCLRD